MSQQSGRITEGIISSREEHLMGRRSPYRTPPRESIQYWLQNLLIDRGIADPRQTRRATAASEP